MLAVVAGFLGSLGAPVPKQDAKDNEALQGTWIVVSAIADGKPRDEIKGEKIIFKDGNITVTSRGKEEKGTYKLDPGKKPRTIDLTHENKQGKTETIAGIYTLEGDTLKICIGGKPGDARPTDFKTEGFMVLNLKREKK
jgi:uncharacterized protein (TIGR03067 family)